MSQTAHTKYKWLPYATEWNPPPLKISAYATGSGTIIGSFCAIESYEQSLLYDFTVCFDSSFWNHDDNKSNNTEQAWSSHQLLYQLRKLGSD